MQRGGPLSPVRRWRVALLVLAGLVTALNLLLSLVVGLRLLARARRGWPAPELTLALYCLLSAFFATPPEIPPTGPRGDCYDNAVAESLAVLAGRRARAKFRPGGAAGAAPARCSPAARPRSSAPPSC